MASLFDKLLSRQSHTPAFPGCAGWALAVGDRAKFADPNGNAAGFDGASGTARFLITSSRKDRHGDVVLPDGCKSTLADYAANPVVFFGHDSGGLPIGSCQKDDGSVDLEFDDAGIYGRVKFHLKTKLSEDVCALCEAGELRGSSIGFKPVEAVLHEGKMERLDEESKVIKFEPFCSFTFTKWDLLEWSVVAVPANADALRCRMEKGFGGKPLSDEIKRLLAPHLDASKAWSPGASFPVPVSDQPSPDLTPDGSAGGDGPGAGAVVKEAEPKRPARKPGELFFLKTLSEIDRHHKHYECAADDQEHPEVVGYCRDSMGSVQKHRKKTLAKAEELYPEVDFSMPASMDCETPEAETSDIAAEDLELILGGLRTLTESQSRMEARFRHATGKV